MGNHFDPELNAVLTGILGADFMQAGDTVGPADLVVKPKPEGHAAITGREGNVLRVEFGKAA